MLEGEGTRSRKKSRFMHYELRVTVKPSSKVEVVIIYFILRKGDLFRV